MNACVYSVYTCMYSVSAVSMTSNSLSSLKFPLQYRMIYFPNNLYPKSGDYNREIKFCFAIKWAAHFPVMPKAVSRQIGEVLFIICYISHIRFRARIGSGCAGSSGK